MIDLTESQVMANWGVDNAENPLVSIRCITYNQQDYISAALDGFLMQKTTFPFEIVVHDDASLDKTADIIREYEAKFPKIIKPIYETENQYSKSGNPLGKIVNAALKGKYVAYCEGDDYWIDENKLQMQVDFLENNPEYGMCYTRAKVYSQVNKTFVGVNGREKNKFEQIIVYGNPIPTLTCMAHRALFMKYILEINPSSKNWKMGDLPMWLWFSKNYKIKFFKKITSVYRVCEESVSHSSNKEKKIAFSQSCLDIRKFYTALYNQPELIDQHHFYQELICAWKKKDRKSIIINGKQLSNKYKNCKARIVIFIAHSKLFFTMLCKFLKK